RRLAYGFEDRGEILALPDRHAGGDDDLGVAHILGGQAFEQAASYQRVIFGGSQPLPDGAERAQKSVELRVAIQGAKFLNGSSRVELVEGFGFNRTFQVQVQFGFGNLQEE